MRFFDAQRSGETQSPELPWRRSAHLDDGREYGLDLSGGYYDAGDYVKFGLPGAFSMTTLAMSAVLYGQGHLAARNMERFLIVLRHGMDYIMRCHPDRERYVVQVGDPGIDHSYWGEPENENSTMFPRPVYFANTTYPGTEPVAEAAAALAAGSIVFRKTQRAYADLLLRHAKELFLMADLNRDYYQDGVEAQARALRPEQGGGRVSGVTDAYESSGYSDDLAWSSVWLHLATGDEAYLDQAMDVFDDASLEDGLPGNYQSWDDKSVGTAILLAKITRDADRVGPVQEYGRSLLATKKTKGGLFWLQDSRDASCNVALSAAYAAFMIHDFITPDPALVAFANGQMAYILGKNPLNQPYVVIHGDERSPKFVHHAASQGVPLGAGPRYMRDPKPNLHILEGAVVGGPRFDDSWRDKRVDYRGTEPALDYTAAWTTVLARSAAYGTVL